VFPEPETACGKPVHFHLIFGLFLMEKPSVFSDTNQSGAIWAQVVRAVKNQLSETAFSLWIEPLRPADFHDGVLFVESPDAFFAGWVQNHYHQTLLSAARAVDSSVKKIVFLAKDSAGGVNCSEIKKGVGEGQPSEGLVQKSRPRDGGCLESNLNPLYNFENFVVGESNRLAHAAALSVSRSPGTAYNPLFIYGQVGVGKTHLMQAVGNYFFDRPDFRVVYLSSEQFLNRFIESLQNKNTVDFRNRFRELDLLLIDDIQFICGKEETQREFFHTFNALYDYHKQIVLSSDRPPRELKNLERRLVSRFEWGLVVDIQPPDLETRVAIINNKAKLKNFPLPGEVAFYLAERIEGSVRSLEGALTKLIACAGLYDKKVVDVKFVEEILKDVLDKKNIERKININSIQEWVSGYFNIKPSELKSDRRQATVVFPRQVAIYMCRLLTGASLPQIGESFGGKNHTTILYTCKKFEDKLKKDVNFKKEIEGIIQKFKQDVNFN